MICLPPSDSTFLLLEYVTSVPRETPIIITESAMQVLRLYAVEQGFEFAADDPRHATALPHGQWLIKLDEETLAGFFAHKLPRETLSDTIVRMARDMGLLPAQGVALQ